MDSHIDEDGIMTLEICFEEKARQMFLHQSESILFPRSGKRIDAYGNIERPIQQLVGTTKADRIRECKLRFLDIVAQVEDGKTSKKKGLPVFSIPWK